MTNANLNLGDLIKYIDKGYCDYLKQEEIEDSERYKLRKKLSVMTSLVISEREVKEALSREFYKERERLRKMSSESLDKAVEIGDVETAEIILQFINVVYSKNIF